MSPQERRCYICKVNKSTSDFYSHGGGMLSRRCKKCDSDKAKSRSKTKGGLISIMYITQKRSSIKRGHQPPQYSKKELEEWLLSKKEFHEIFAKWEKSGYSQLEIPSCDRLDDYKGYSIDNIRIVSWRENKRKYAEDRLSGKNTKQSSRVAQYSTSGQLINEYHSMRHAQRKTGVEAISISMCTRGKAITAGGFIWKKIEDPNDKLHEKTR